MINKVQLDLLKKHIGPFFFCFFVLMFLLLMQFLMLHVDKLVGKGLPILVVIELILSNLAYMVVLAVPMAILVANLVAFGKFSEWNELTAVRAAGVNPIKLVLPVLGASVLLFISTSYFSNYILPEANHKARSLFIDIRMAKPGFDLEENSFYEGIEGYTFLVRQIDSESDTLRNLTIFQEPVEDRYRAFIRADSGILESEDDQTLSLFLHDGSILRYIPGQNRGTEKMERTDFSRYRLSFDLSELSFSRTNPESRSRTGRTMSGEAMLAVVDTLKDEVQKEFLNFTKRTMQEEQVPFKLDASTDMYHISASENDTLPPFDTDLPALQILEGPESQISALNSAINSLNRHKADVESFKSNIDWRFLRIAEFWVEIHKKLSIPFACILFVMIGAPIGMLTRNGNLGVAALISAVILTIYFIAIIQGEKFADRGIISPFMGMWGINMIYFIIGLLLMLHVCTPLKITNLLQSNE
ncbi:MAG: LptF/LptG family permease [Bacteroidetes bacterium]|jgi:lipopolysaccharide export system permease protein|nr:LptF/LptG family permease [Bacteroidota bacterium]